MNGCYVRRLLSHQLADILGKLGEEGTSEMHPARICKGFERSGYVEIARDLHKVVSSPVASTVPEALAREAPCRSIPRPWIVQRRPGWS